MLAEMDRFDVLLSFALLAGAFLLRHRSGAPALVPALVAGAALALLAVLANWLSGRSPPNAVGGLIPWDDAPIYLNCAGAYLRDSQSTAGCGMRPYYSVFFGTFLALAGGVHQASLLVQAAVGGLGAGAAAWATGRVYGWAGALAAGATILLFANQFTTAHLTENAGLLLGSLALMALWTRAGKLGVGEFAAIFAALTAAQLARMGAVFVLPCLLAWAVLWSAGDRRGRLARAAAAVAAMALAWAVNAWLSRLLGGAAAEMNSNFSYTFYGMTVGGARYTQILIDHPELTQLPPSEFSRAAYALVFDNLRERPHLFVLGYLRGLVHYVYELFRFVPALPLRAVMVALWLAGVAVTARRWREPRARLVLVLLAGVVVSAPVLTWSGGNRVFAATYALDAILIAAGLDALLRRLGATAAGGGVPGPRLAHAAALVAALPVVLVPLLPRLGLLPPIDRPVSCAEGERSLLIELGRDASSLTLAPSGATGLWPLRVPHAGFAAGLDRWIAYRDELAALPAGSTIIQGAERRPDGMGVGRRFLWDGPMPPPGPVAVCLRDDGAWMPHATRIDLLR